MKDAPSHSSRLSQAVGLFGFLSCPILFGALLLEFHHTLGWALALGWSVRPGPRLVCFLFCVLAGGYLQQVPPRALGIVGCSFMVPMLVEFLGPVVEFRGPIGLIVMLLGASVAWRIRPRSQILLTGVAALLAYCAAVLLYNEFGGQHAMNFFRPGWTS